MRKRLATTGERGKLVRLFEDHQDGEKRYTVQWGPKAARHQQSWPGTKKGKAEADAFFKAFEEELESKDAGDRPRMTMRQLWKAYLAAEEKHLRKNTVRLYTDAWNKWEAFAKPTSIAEDVTIGQIHEYRNALDGMGLRTATVQDAIRNVRIVYNWAERNELIVVNKWHLFVYKVAKENRTRPRAEYRAEEFLAIWKSLNPAWRGQWRAWVAVGLLGVYGSRQNEILNLQWSWIKGDDILVDPQYVKTGEEPVLALFPLTKSILEVARQWRETIGYTGDYVLFPGQYEGRKHQNKSPHYSIQSLTAAIHLAEKRAGVERIQWRAGHGFRRGLVGDLVDATGDVTLALQAIGDRDMKMLKHYRAKRRDRVDKAVQDRAERLVPEQAPAQ